ncbi:MAG: hypothetical protein HYU80_03255 [Candidatus Blackburnbacteria bacterium]|nr:hypothetical protein [Candidatus Blackburnbacteria bacterium]
MPEHIHKSPHKQRKHFTVLFLLAPALIFALVLTFLISLSREESAQAQATSVR